MGGGLSELTKFRRGFIPSTNDLDAAEKYSRGLGALKARFSGRNGPGEPIPMVNSSGKRLDTR